MRTVTAAFCPLWRRGRRGRLCRLGISHANAELTLVLLSDDRIALSVAGIGLAGGSEYGLTATLTASAAGRQSRAFTLLATVTALAKRDLYSRRLNPGHPAGALTVFSTIFADELTASLVFAHLGEGATVTVDAGGEVGLLAAAVAGAAAAVSAAATSDDFLGLMLFTASVTVRMEPARLLAEEFVTRRAAAEHAGDVYTLLATPENGATAAFYLSGKSARFAVGERDGVLRATTALSAGGTYYATVAAVSGDTQIYAGARGAATLEVIALTARAVSVAAVNPGAGGVLMTFALEAADNVSEGAGFAGLQADGLTIFTDGAVSLTVSAVAGSVYSALAGGVSPGFAGTMIFAAEITTRMAVRRIIFAGLRAGSGRAGLYRDCARDCRRIACGVAGAGLRAAGRAFVCLGGGDGRKRRDGRIFAGNIGAGGGRGICGDYFGVGWTWQPLRAGFGDDDGVCHSFSATGGLGVFPVDGER